MIAPLAIELLADHEEILPTIADWYVQAWPPYYGIDGPGDAHADLASRCNRETIPIGLVAFEQHELCGVAGKLLGSAVRHATRLGFRRVSISTNVLGNHLQRNGWRLFGETRFLNEERGLVYVFDLQDR